MSTQIQISNDRNYNITNFYLYEDCITKDYMYYRLHGFHNL